MAIIEFKEGKLPFKVPSVDEPCFTYYKIFGDLSAGTPVIVAHGGPGVGHEYLLTFSALWRDYGLPVIFYDQIGCASSTHLREKAGDKSFWVEQLFQDELDNLIDHLQLRASGFHFLGHSWGGMLGSAFAARQPEGLKRLVLASSLASKDLSTRGTYLLREQMPTEMRQALEEAEKNGEYDSPGYKRALEFYQKTFVCRVEDFPPPELAVAFKNMMEDPTVYRSMNGPSPLTSDGSLEGWTVIPRLGKITAPTLMYSGEFDTSHEVAQIPLFELIPRVRWITFPNAGHMLHLEGPAMRARVLKVVGDFLTQKEVEESS